MTREDRIRRVRAFWDHWNACNACGMPPETSSELMSSHPLCTAGRTLWFEMEEARKDVPSPPPQH